MKCPECGEKTFCKETREMVGYVRRRHECLSCKHRITTVEVNVPSSSGMETPVRELMDNMFNGVEHKFKMARFRDQLIAMAREI